nr:sugar-binding domain-containing protein [uncultured Dyadobacter sp.]
MKVLLHARVFILMTVLTFTFSETARSQSSEKSLWQPYRVTERAGSQHVELSGDGWRLGYTDKPVGALSELKGIRDEFQTSVPNSVQWSYYKAGKLPHPYYHKNSEQYAWMDEKVWYYRKSFQMPQSTDGQYAFLCFEGLDYFSKVWVNDSLVGVHEGMFGGPTVEISRFLKTDNEIVVEVKAGNWGNKASKPGEAPVRKGFDPRNTGKIIKPWVISGGLGGEAFFSVGMWQGVRLEVVPKVHLERPFLTTSTVSEKQADLHLSLELLAGESSTNLTLHPWKNTQMDHPDNFGQKFEPVSGDYAVQIELSLDGKSFIKKSWKVDLTKGRNWLEKDIIVPNPRLWNLNGLGKAESYDVKIALLDAGKQVDLIGFKHGIRKIDFVPTAGPRTRDRWDNWQFVINGRKVFVKGMNFTPQDILLDLSPERYRWTLQAAHKMGVQMIRIWGGGLLETKQFYEICDELGMMVWQDFPVGNQDSPDFPQDVWEAQVVQNILRLRNHPSLAIWCGGNEFNPYSTGNTAVIGIVERNLKIFDPSRPFKRTTPDHGAVHVYPDMDPVWYNHSYAKVPWISETGVHSLPEANVFYETVDNQEFKELGKMWDKDFAKDHPEFIHHFTEYGPSRVPRMLSRASHIVDVTDPSIEDIAEASQVGAGEFYQVFSEKVQGNYPVTAGLIPWVFKRHWPVVAIQLMDWFGHAAAPYYFLKRTYEPTHVAVDIPRLLWRAGEQIDLPVKITHATPVAMNGGKLSVLVMDDAFKVLWQGQKTAQVAAGTSVTGLDMGKFAIPAGYRDRFLLVLAELKDPGGRLISRSCYYPRVLSKMDEEAFYKDYTTTPIPWITLEKGPWLKPAMSHAPQAELALSVTGHQKTDQAHSQLKVKITNHGKVPSFMTKLDIIGARRAFVAADNYFWLAAGESREIVLDVLWREPGNGDKPILTVKGWNSAAVQSPL